MTGDPIAAEDERRLAALGYQQELPRLLRFWSNFAIGFAFISPIVGMYTVAALEVQTAGPAWIWSVVIVLAGQMLVAVVMAELGSRWPIAGGLYQWALRLIGPRFGWWTAWLFIWSGVATLSVIAYAGGGFLGELLGIDTSSTTTSIELALVVIAFFTLVNAIGLHLLRFIVNVGISAEIVASVIIGGALILFYRHAPVSALVHTSGAVAPGKSVLPAFVAALAFGGWVLFGFDACGAIAEETQNASRQVPRAILMSLATVGVIDVVVIAGLMLAQPSIADAVSGKTSDPVSAPVTAAFGSWITKPFLAIVVLGFVSCGIAVQAATVRVIYSFARDDMLPLSKVWRRVSRSSSTPIGSVLLTGGLAALIFLYAKVLNVLVAFATGGVYLSYLAVVGAMAFLRLRRRWSPDTTAFSLGSVGTVASVVAAGWLVFEFINIAWPRNGSLPWYQNWAMLVGSVALGAIGGVYFVATRPDRKFTLASAAAGRLADEAAPAAASDATQSSRYA